MNAQLWCKIGQEKVVLKSWLREHGIKYNDDMSIEELRQLYIRKECGNE